MPIKPSARELEAPILIVEPTRALAEEIAGLLLSYEYRIDIVRSAEEAIEHLAQRKPAAVIINNHLPGMSASDLRAHIRRSPDLDSLFCIVLQSDGDPYFDPADATLSPEEAARGFYFRFRISDLSDFFLEILGALLLWETDESYRFDPRDMGGRR